MCILYFINLIVCFNSIQYTHAHTQTHTYMQTYAHTYTHTHTHMYEHAHRHIQLVTALKPSTRILCEMYYSKATGKILHMRSDTIARMLTVCNVHANTRLVVVDTTQGLLVASVLERMGGM